MEIKCMITYGEKPVGRGIGPAHEAIDVLNVLDGKGPRDLGTNHVKLQDFFLRWAAKLKGKGKDIAEKLIDSGRHCLNLEK